MSPDDAGMTAVFGTIGRATIALVLFIGNLVVVNLIRGLPRRNLYAEAIALALLQADRLFSVYPSSVTFRNKQVVNKLNHPEA